MKVLFAILWSLRKVLNLAYSFGTIEPAGEHIEFSQCRITRTYGGVVFVERFDEFVGFWVRWYPHIPFFTYFSRYVDYGLWQLPCETGERPSTWEVFKYSMKNYYHYEIYMYLVGKWALLEKRVKEYFLTLYYTYAFRLLLRLHADPNMEKIINAYLDNEKVIVPAGPDGLFTLDQVIAVHKWNEAVTRPDFLPVRDIENEHIWKCEICQERESYFQAMSLNEMGEFMPDWATAILAQYEDKDLPVCPNATNTK